MRRLQTIVALAILSMSASASADPLETRVGTQFLSAGMHLQPGFLRDSTIPAEPDWNENAATASGVVRVGLHHLLARSVMMGVEIDLGSVWYDEHTLNSVARADSEYAFTVAAGLTGRWFLLGEGEGPSVGLGLHARWDMLDEVTFNTFSPHIRLGWTWWQEAEYLQLEVGYSTPFIAGLNLPTDFSGEAPEAAEQDSRLHTFSLGFNVGF